MKITILGCGPSYGLPSLSRGFCTCSPEEPKNRRTRSSLLIRNHEKAVLIDSSPEVRLQLLNAGNPPLSGVIYTHAHYDHMGGAGDLINAPLEKERLPVYLGEADERLFRQQLSYVFNSKTLFNLFELHRITAGIPFDMADLRFLPLPQRHGAGDSFGFRFENVAYSTDVSAVDEAYFEALAGIDVWILGVVSPIKSNNHLNLEQALAWINRVRPKKAYLTHMGGHMDYARLKASLPDHVYPAYDGLEITV